MKRRRNLIPQRRRIFVGCEGESERSYVTLISRLLEERHRRVHLDPVPLGGGDPLGILEKALRQLDRRARQREPYAAQAILLDADKRRHDAKRSAQAASLAAQCNVHLIWQDPSHEALLLRHLPGCEQLRPPTAQHAMTELRRRWPDYEKGMPAVRLATCLGREAVLRAASVDGELCAFLDRIGFGREGS